MTETGDKHRLDDGKVRFDLIPPNSLMELAVNYTVGAKKYGPHGYLQDGGMEWSRIVASMERHLNAWKRGRTWDEEGFHHLAAVAWGALTLIEYERRGYFDKDDVHVEWNSVVE